MTPMFFHTLFFLTRNGPCQIRRWFSTLIFAVAVCIGIGCDAKESASHDAHADEKPAAKKDAHAGHGHEEKGHAEHGPNYGFEWGGIYPLQAGKVEIVLQPGPDDPFMNVTLLPVSASTSEALEAVVAQAAEVFKKTPQKIKSGDALAPAPELYQMRLDREEMRLTLNVSASGPYALFTEHFPTEFKTRFVGAGGEIRPVVINEYRVSEIALTSEAIRTFGIRTAPAKSQVLIDSFTAPARVALNTEAMAHVGTSVAGRISELKVRVGDAVKKGDVLLVIDSPELGTAQSEYLQKRTAAKTAAPAVELARSAHERARKLLDETQGTSLTEVQKRQAEVQAAQAALATAESALAAAENALHLLGMDQAAVKRLAETSEIDPKYVIRTPLDGQVIEREVTLGERVSPERESLLVIADFSIVWVLADVPEARASVVTAGIPAVIKLAATRNESFEGKVSFVSPQLNEATRTVLVRIEVKNDKGLLKPGMFAQVQINGMKTADGEPVLVVPETAIQTIEEQPVVFVAVEGEANTFAKRPVMIGHAVGGLVPIKSGLKEGELVATTGTFILKADLGKSGAAHEH
ncbi:MAG: efflux RND transporter periplasmic adaptor subunit [Tepidisphaeraceae bacterium]